MTDRMHINNQKGIVKMSNRKSFLAIGAIAMLVLNTGAQAQQSPIEMYGQLGIGLNARTGISTVPTTDLSDNQLAVSFLGFRGNEDLGGGMKALYRLEMTVAADAGTAGATVAGNSKLFNRQSYFGLNFGSPGTLTLGRQFHAAIFRVVSTLDPQNAAGALPVTPIGLFGINRFVGNDTRVDNSIKYHVAGPAGVEGSVSYGLGENVSTKSYSVELAQLTSAYQIAAWMVNYSAPTVIAGTGYRPAYLTWGFGGQAPVGPVKLYANFLRSKLDATVAGRGTQDNKVTTLGVAWAPAATTFKLIYTHDQGSTLNGVAGRDGTKKTLVASAEYYLSKRTSIYGAVYENRFADGYLRETVNLAALGRDPTSDAVRGISIGMRHRF